MFKHIYKNHNTINKCQNLTQKYSLDELSAMISTGLFDDIYVGDYIETDIKPSVDGAILALSGNITSGVTAYDISGNANNATMNNITLSSDTDKSFVFNGTNSSFSNISGSLLGAKSEFTIFLQANIKSSANQSSMFADYSISYPNIIMGYKSSNGFLTYIRKASSGAHQISHEYPINTDLTYAVSFKGSNYAKIYINGIQVEEITTDLPSTINFSENSLEIGHWGNYYFNGTMKGIKIYPRALSAEEILQLHNASQNEGLTERVRWLVAGLDHYLHCGNTSINDHHLVMVAEDCLKNTAKMNATNTTAGGYAGSYGKRVIESIYGCIYILLGNHVYNPGSSILLSNSMSDTTPSMAGAGLTGASNGWEWRYFNTQLMNEIELYGTTVLSSSFFDIGSGKSQFPLFKQAPELIQCGRGINGSIESRSTFWLRSVTSSTAFCYCYNNGAASNGYASNSNGVRPFFLFI